MISQLTFFLFSMSSSTEKNHLKSAKILVNRNEKSNSFLGMTSRTCCNLIGCWGMANLFSSNLEKTFKTFSLYQGKRQHKVFGIRQTARTADFNI